MSLALIIPAYKISFFEKTLQSLANQTCKNFNVYIGDDCSPNDLYSVVENYLDKLNIVYVKFDENLGSRSLVQHWIRCINLSKSEKWIWLFSDDDIISENCVFDFYKNVNSESELYKFRTTIINSNNENIKYKERENIFKKSISSSEFIQKRLNGRGFRSYVVEYIFSRNIFNKNSIIDMPLAWCSDDLMWTYYSLANKQTITCLKSVVYWRNSGENITSITDNHEVGLKKIEACLACIEQLKILKDTDSIIISNFLILKWLTRQVSLLSIVNDYSDFQNIFKHANISKSNITKNIFYQLFNYYKIKYIFISKFKKKYEKNIARFRN